MGRVNYMKLTSFSDLRRIASKLLNQRNNTEITSEKYNDLLRGLRAMREFLESEFLHSDTMRRLAALEGEEYNPPPPSEQEEDEEDRAIELEVLNESQGIKLAR